MTVERKSLPRWQRWAFKVPVWLYQVHLGWVFGGRIFVIAHHGRVSGKGYLSGLEILERRDGELLVFSAWGRRADWFRNIEAGGVDALWDGRERYTGASYRVVDATEAVDVLRDYEHDHERTAKQTLTRMRPGYDFSDGQRRELAETAVIVAFRPVT